MRADNHDTETFQPIGLHAKRLVSNLIKLRKFPEVLDGPSIVGEGGITGDPERPQIKALPFFNDPRDVAIAPRIEVNPLKARYCFARSLVRVVLLAACRSDIREGIIAAIAVDVIDQRGGPFAVNVKPSKPRGFIKKIVYADEAITLEFVYASSSLAYQIHADMLGLPGKDSCFPVIVEHFPQSFGGQSAAASFVRHISKPPAEKQDQRAADTGQAEQKKETEREAQRAYVDRRLEDIRAFEERAKGIVQHRARRHRE